MANARGKTIDGTYLSIEQATDRGFIHGDYLGHCLRWSHIVRFIRSQNNYKTARVLDIGCGKEVPLAKTLYSSRLIIPQYVGCDYNKSSSIDMSPFHTGKFSCATFGSVDFASDQVFFDRSVDDENLINVVGDSEVSDYFLAPNVYVSLEVMEHIEPAHVRATFMKVRKGLELAKENGSAFEPVFFMSTPNYDLVHLADNHVNEMRHEATGWLIEDCGLEIRGRFGTFASQKDYKKKFFSEYPGAEEIFNKLHGYYDSNYLSTIFAPLYPAEARNCLWEITLPTGKTRQFPDLPEPPWTSSDRWQDLSSSDASLYDSANTGIGRIAK